MDLIQVGPVGSIWDSILLHGYLWWVFLLNIKIN